MKEFLQKRVSRRDLLIFTGRRVTDLGMLAAAYPGGKVIRELIETDSDFWKAGLVAQQKTDLLNGNYPPSNASIFASSKKNEAVDYNSLQAKEDKYRRDAREGLARLDKLKPVFWKSLLIFATPSILVRFILEADAEGLDQKDLSSNKRS